MKAIVSSAFKSAVLSFDLLGIYIPNHFSNGETIFIAILKDECKRDEVMPNKWCITKNVTDNLQAKIYGLYNEHNEPIVDRFEYDMLTTPLCIELYQDDKHICHIDDVNIEDIEYINPPQEYFY